MSHVPEVLESPEEVLTTLTRDGKRRWIYPTPSPGRFERRRRVVAWALILAYVLLPIVRIGDYPAVLIDFIHREFALFGLVFYPTDTVLLMAFLIAILSVVVLGTALLGRVWCGWACPQTVYLEYVFRPIERLIEGREHVRKRRDKGARSLDLAWRKGAKLAVYTVISAMLAHTFVAYFVGWSNLILWMTEAPEEHWGFFVLMAATTGLVLFDFGYFREQMCTIACPYARMQSVLLDPDSLIVSYDPGRGEPRTRRSRTRLREEADGLIPSLGDCVDCNACVRTCPTGIDIRDGLQMECIACTQCVDACDSIMDRIGRPHGLISYTSENRLAGVKTRLVRPRTILYVALLLMSLSAFTVVLTNRSDFDINLGRAVGAPYTVLPDGRIANRIRFRVRNQSGTASSFDIRISAPAGAELRPVGAMPVPLEEGAMDRIEAWVVLPPEVIPEGRLEAEFVVGFQDGSSTTTNFTLLGPTN